GTTRTLQIPAHFERNGTFRIEVALQTPAGQQIGETILINVRTTAYGGIALIITSIAFAVLVVALALRFVRRLRARAAAKSADRDDSRPADIRPDDTQPVPVVPDDPGVATRQPRW